MDTWDIGERVVGVIGRSAPQCILSELVAALVPTEVLGVGAGGILKRQRASLGIPVAMINQVIVGGVDKELVDLVQYHRLESAHGRQTALDACAIRPRGLAGVDAGRQILMAALAEGASELAILADVLAGQLGRCPVGHIPVDGDPIEPSQAD
jgi:hypothetical protein